MEQFKKAYAELNKEQREAVDSIEGPLLVIAGPGTGKTQLLALRAAHILDCTDTAPQNILCLTYTENGALNMRQRLIKYAGQTAYDIRISTYHSFGSELMREYGDYFNSGEPGEPADKLAQHAIMQEIYAELPASNPLWRSDVYLKDALGVISEFKKALLTPEDVRTLANANLAFINEASTKITKSMAGFTRMSKSTVSYFEEISTNLNRIKDIAVLPGDTMSLRNISLAELEIALEAFNSDGKYTKLVTTWKDKWLEKNNQNEWVFGGTREARKMLGAADIFENYMKLLEEKKLFDYDDMILRAIDGLQTHDDLRFTLQEKYLYIMLDEFQDTNPAQLRLIELLTNNPVSNRRPDVMAVGDDDQAIFSFQGADHTNMLKFYDLYDEVHTVNLTENWRSHKDIVAASRSVAEQIEQRIHHDPRIGLKEKKLIAVNPDLPKESILERREFSSDVAQFSWIADTVAQRIKDGVPPSEIAILAPRHKHLEPLVTYLNAHGIPIHYEKRENVLEEPRIVELLAIVRLASALHNNDNGLADALWPSVLSADFWQLPISSIWKLSWQANANHGDSKHKHWHELMMDDNDFKPIALFFAKLTASAETETLETMLDYITGILAVDLHEPDLESFTSPFFEYYFGKDAAENDAMSYVQLLSNLTVLREHLREYKRDELRPLVLQDLLDFVSNYEQAGEKLLNTSPYHSASNAVELMTSYGAKGMEFQTVFVIAASDEIWGSSAKDRSSVITLPKNMSYIRRAGSTKDERKRLFFVALSRAKTELQITNYRQNFAGKNFQSLEFLDERTNQDETRYAAALPEGKQAIIQHGEEGVAAEQLRDFWYSRHHKGLVQPELKAMVRPRLDGFQMSATHVNGFTDLIYGGPQAFFLNTILRFPKAPTTDGQFGNAMHETMKDIHHYQSSEGELPDTDTIIGIFEKRLTKKRLSSVEHNRQFERGKLALELFVPAWREHFMLEGEAERDFRNEGAFVGEAHLSGILDQIMKDTDTKELMIVDFKTGKSHEYWKRDDPKLHKYKQQLLFYKILAENAASYRGFEATEGKLVFLEPNEDGEVKQLRLQYSDEDIDRMKKLIAVIWQHIQDLNFPDVSAYPKNAKGIIKFEDDLLAGKI